MEAAKALIENCWIDKKKDKELYMKVRRKLPRCQKFFREQLGWTIINNEQILKVEKIPAHAESYMGITDFMESRDYCLFCVVLSFLEDKEEQEQFLLSELIDMLELQLKGVMDMDWIFHAHIGNLVTYGTFMEECFAERTTDAMVLRKRHRIVSYMQGRKLYFEEFYQVIKERIDETELLIRQKDRELFENILSDTLSRKLNVRIAESRKWIQDMSSLMQKMDTSMSLTFSLDWRAKTAEGEGKLDTAELEKMLNRDRELMTAEDIERISAHFRNKIYTVKQMAEENGEVLSYSDLVREALDYRKWLEFKMFYYRNSENKKELTNGAFNRFSGGEKAMAMYVPLFAAVNAQYKKAENDDFPRMIALDEAFAGVDDKNISSMFDLVRKFDFDYIINSQVLWGCYASVPFLRIAELLRPANSQVVTVIYYLWNGKQRIIEEQ